MKRKSIKIIEWVVLAAIIVLLVMLLLPTEQWVADGELELTVRVHVFDALTYEPIANAKVAVIYGYYKLDRHDGDAPQDVFPYRLDELPPEFIHETDAKGVALIPQKFSTVASSQNPKPRALLSTRWVIVFTENYSSVAIPVGPDWLETQTLKDRGGVDVPIGLMPAR